MLIAPSPLERWFTAHPGPYTHSLAAVSATPLASEAVAAWLPDDFARTFDMGYGPPEGALWLRETLAAMYGLPDADHVLVTHGAVEANWLALAVSLAPGDAVVVQTPIYPQLPCVAAGLGARILPWTLPLDPRAPVDLDALWRLLAQGPRLLILNSPHNPTGRVLPEDTLRAILDRARAQGCRVLVDEVYRDVGSAPLPPSALAWGAEGVVVSNSVSKAMALPGLRLGWLAGDPAVIAAAVPWREHTTLALSGPPLAVLEAVWAQRPYVIRANQAVVARNRALVSAWAAQTSGYRAVVTDTAAVCLLEGPPGTDDLALAEAWGHEGEGFVIPGTVCGYPGTFRIGFGHRDGAQLTAALAAFGRHLSLARV